MNYIDENNKLQTQTSEYATLTLTGSSTDNNSIGAITVPNFSGKILTVVKNGIGRWKMISNNSNFNGGVLVEQGELVLAAGTET